MFSNLGDIQYHYECGGIPCVHRGMFSTSEKTISTLEGRDIMSTSVGGEGYHEYIGGCSAHQRDIMMHLGEQLDKFFQFLLKTPVYS